MKSFSFRGYTLPAKRIAVFGAAFGLWILGLLLSKIAPDQSRESAFSAALPLFFFLASWLLAGFPVLKNAALNFLPCRIRNNPLDENFLMSAATIGAFVIGEWAEAAAVMIFYMIGELIQEAAVERSRSSINALLALKPDKARVQDGESWREVAAEDVNPGSIVLVRPGERIPLDGIIIEGKGSLDLSMLTGESLPEPCMEGNEVRSGTISLDGVLLVKTTKSSGDSSAARIIKLVQGAQEAKARPERFISSFARVYTPLVVGGAVLLALLPPILIPEARFSDWFYRSLILLVISCPCALVVSVPLGYFAGIGGMSRRGIMVKGAVHLDSLNKTKNVAFDKTGTLTKGKFSVTTLEPAPGISNEILIETAALAEGESNHPIARAIMEYTENEKLGMRNGEFGIRNEKLGMRNEECQKYNIQEIAGQGLELVSSETKILAGSRRLLESRLSGQSLPPGEPEANTPVYIAKNNEYLGRILVGDSLKDGAAEAINQLNKMSIKTSMFTGDIRSSALKAASQLGIASVEAEMLPEDKLAAIEKLAGSGTTVFVGDGINDAPVLARSHVGIAMGGGADVAVEAADVIIMTGDPRRVPEAIERARKTHRIVMGNVAFALSAKGFFIILAGLGMANMWIALIADVGVALAAILNSTRALKSGV